MKKSLQSHDVSLKICQKYKFLGRIRYQYDLESRIRIWTGHSESTTLAVTLFMLNDIILAKKTLLPVPLLITVQRIIQNDGVILFNNTWFDS
jgi:hypothetical protein